MLSVTEKARLVRENESVWFLPLAVGLPVRCCAPFPTSPVLYTNKYSRSRSSSPQLGIVEAAVPYMQSLHPTVSVGALTLALTLSKNDVAFASFVLNRALTLPPICRHLLAGGCYR